ncbi:MAG: glycosyltransferase family 4 protein, partial [Chloroflexota bacterium]
RLEHLTGQRNDIELPPAGRDGAINYIHLNGPELIEHALPGLGEGFFKQRYNIGYWMFEVDRPLNSKWQAAFAYVDEIWTASDYTQQILARQSPVPVYRVPHPIHLSKQDTQSRTEFDLPEDAFIFLFVFDSKSTIARKNPLAVIEAFKLACADVPYPPTLVLQTSSLERFPDLSDAIYTACSEPNILLINDYWTRQQMSALYGLVDAYVSLHRSEGYGMGMAEAMSMGSPVIATGWSGNMDYMSADNSFPVNFDLVPISEAHHGPQASDPKILRLYPPDSGIWADPDINHAAHLMRTVCDQPQQARLMGESGARTIAENYSHAAVGSIMVGHFQRIVREHQPVAPPEITSSHYTYRFDHERDGVTGLYDVEVRQDTGETFRWSADDQVVMDVRLRQHQNYEITCHVIDTMDERLVKTLRFSVNRTYIPIVFRSVGYRRYTITGIIPDYIIDRDMDRTRIIFEISDPVVTEHDPRRLGIAFSDVEISPTINRSQLLSDRWLLQQQDLHEIRKQIRYHYSAWEYTRMTDATVRGGKWPVIGFFVRTVVRVRNIGKSWQSLSKLLLHLCDYTYQNIQLNEQITERLTLLTAKLEDVEARQLEIAVLLEESNVQEDRDTETLPD